MITTHQEGKGGTDAPVLRRSPERERKKKPTLQGCEEGKKTGAEQGKTESLPRASARKAEDAQVQTGASAMG
eukprot:CAMPEP_0113539776 /NCGR_PEP_ID=MMETSP0015_2-20120614/8113_1 /TAXON_ID=2838 /ORGANISM="Odontella" /LENGTH=71 /DNA_ID=CAMNT_0000439507 /DNA_START=399 /DNA_END=612 /DNA_ORIENTATION=- /assembly_acc=CAM_ASM_000160